MTFRITLICLLLQACSTPIDVRLPEDYTPRIAVGGVFQADSAWSVFLTQSLPFQTGTIPRRNLITNAVARIASEDEEPMLLTHIGGGIYSTKAEAFPKPGTAYTLTIEVPELGQASASSYAPLLERKLTAFSHIVSLDSVGVDQYGIAIEIDDKPGKNYYQLEINQLGPVCLTARGRRAEDRAGYGTLALEAYFTSSNASLWDDVLYVDDPSLPNEQGDYYGAAWFSDALFDVTTESIEVTVHAQRYESVGQYFLVQVTAFSVDLFKRLRSELLHEEFVFTEDLFPGQPFQAYSNVNNGLGIFAGATNRVDRLDRNGDEWNDSDVRFGKLTACSEE